MRPYLIRRLLLFIPTIFLVVLVVFVVMRIVPGDPAIAILSGEGGDGIFTEQELQDLREKLGTTGSIPVQFFRWLGDLARLDLGNSLTSGFPIIEDLRRRLPITFELAFMAAILSVLIGIPIGIISAVRQDTWIDYVVRVFSMIGLAMPTFWVGVVMVLIMALYFDWIPPLGYAAPWDDPLTNLQQMIWPALALSYSSNGLLARITRAQMLEVMRQDYIRTAWAKGLREWSVIIGHALKNAALPIITLAGIQVGILLGGAAAIEIVFSVPGMGSLLISAIFDRDYPMVQAVVLLIALTYLSANFVVDLMYGWFDPRVRYS